MLGRKTVGSTIEPESEKGRPPPTQEVARPEGYAVRVSGYCPPGKGRLDRGGGGVQSSRRQRDAPCCARMPQHTRHCGAAATVSGRPASESCRSLALPPYVRVGGEVKGEMVRSR